MNAASLQNVAGVPAAAQSTAAAPRGGGGGLTPMGDQGFVPVSAAPAQGAETAAGSTASGATAAQGQGESGAAADGSLPAEQALQALTQVLGDEYSEPIIAADGSVYMEKKKPSVVGGQLQLSYVLVGKVDRQTGRMQVNPAILEQVKAKSASASSQKKLVKVDDQYVWQTFSKDEKGNTVVSDVKPATKEELAAYQQQLQAEQAQQAQKAKLEDRGDWQEKIGTVAQNVGLFGSAGQLISGLASGPNAFTGKPGASWISGWILAQRLNGKAEGKLLPSWMQSGPVATALEWGIQAYGMLDMGNDLRVVRDYLKGAPALPAVNPNAVQQLVAKGTHPAMAGALNQLGTDLRTGGLQMVEGTANAAVLNPKLGAVQLVPKSDLHKAFAATDPIQDAGMKLRGNIDSGVTKGLGLLKGLVQPAMMGATALGLVSSVITVRNIKDQGGAKALLDTQQGRGAVLGAVSSAAFLGLYTLPMILPGLGVAAPAVAAAASAVNIASNVLGGIQMLNSYGLFGGEKEKNGFLDNDAFRAAFLIPPLTPIGAFAFWMKSRKKKQEAEAAKLEAAQKLAVERIQQQREMVKLQLQSQGQVSGAAAAQDGSINVGTNVPNDLSQLAAQMSGGSGGAAAASPAAAAPAASAAPAAAGADQGAGSDALAQQREQLTMTARPMR